MTYSKFRMVTIMISDDGCCADVAIGGLFLRVEQMHVDLVLAFIPVLAAVVLLLSAKMRPLFKSFNTK